MVTKLNQLSNPEPCSCVDNTYISEEALRHLECLHIVSRKPRSKRHIGENLRTASRAHSPPFSQYSATSPSRHAIRVLSSMLSFSLSFGNILYFNKLCVITTVQAFKT